MPIYIESALVTIALILGVQFTMERWAIGQKFLSLLMGFQCVVLALYMMSELKVIFFG